MSTWITYAGKNWKLKAGSLFVALLLFWYVQYSKTTTRVMNIRVERPELPANLIISSRIPSYMNVKIYGPKELMDFNVSDFRISLSNPRPEVGSNIYRAQIYPELPEGVGAAYRLEIPVSLDRVLIRDLPVEPVIDMNLSQGLRPGYMWIKPVKLRVAGPRKIVSMMHKIKTDRAIAGGTLPVYTNKVMISQLPEFVTLDKNQPFDVDLSLRLLPDEIDPETDDSMQLLTDIPIRCSNDTPGLSMSVMDGSSVDILILKDKPELVIKREQFTGEVFCPAFYDIEDQQIKPDATILNMMVVVNDRMNRDTLSILDVIPPRVSLEFEKSVSKTPYEVRQGLKEHLIR